MPSSLRTVTRTARAGNLRAGGSRIGGDDAAGGLIDAAGGDPWGRRVIFLHSGKGAWWRLLGHVPAGQEWVTVPALVEASSEASPATARAVPALAPLLADREGRKPVLVAGTHTAALAFGAALDRPDRIGGVMIVDDMGAESALRQRWNRLTARLSPKPASGLEALEPKLPTLEFPVTLMQGTEPAAPFARLETVLTGCRTLTVVALRDATAIRPRTHAPELRGALAALVAAVERARA